MSATSRAAPASPAGHARRWWAPVAAVAISLLAVAALTALRWHQSWNFSEGVYALTSRLLLHGDDLYGHVVVAQPPGTVLVGSVVLAISDSLTALRIAMALFQVTAGMLAGMAAYRLTGSRAVAAAVVPLSLLMPWAVHDSGELIPELVALPMLAGGAVLAARPAGAAPAGVLLAVAVFTKWPFVAAALLVALVAADRRSTLRWLAIGLAVQAVVYTAAFGAGVWGDTVIAQLHSFGHGPRYLAGGWAQALWNLLGLVGGCGLLAWRLRHGDARRDERQLLTSIALAVGTLLTLPTFIKGGTGLSIIVPIELALLPLAAGGCWAAWRAARGVPLRIFVAVAVMLPVLQGVSLALSPVGEGSFRRPWSRPAFPVVLRASRVDAEIRRARACPRGAVYSGIALIAFLADRRMPDDQPDTFLTTRTDYFRSTLARMVADRPRCP